MNANNPDDDLAYHSHVGVFRHAQTLARYANGARLVWPFDPSSAILSSWKAFTDGYDDLPIHGTDADRADLLQSLESPTQDLDQSRLEDLSRRALAVMRRLDVWVVSDQGLQSELTKESTLEQILEGLPIFRSESPNQSKDELKRHIELVPLREPPPQDKPVGVFLHLYYDKLAPLFAQRFAESGLRFGVYISTDTAEKAAHIRQYFPETDIRIAPNRGRDIYPKLYHFPDVMTNYDILLHLHGKQSVHSSRLKDWLSFALDCLLPDPPRIQRILSLFAEIPRLGLLAPAPIPAVLPAIHWGRNYQTARRVAQLLNQPAPRRDALLRFPAGSMFWARRDAVQALSDLALQPEHFPAENRQLDGTLAHALERMLGVNCENAGYHQLFVNPPKYGAFRRFREKFRDNPELAAWLDREEQRRAAESEALGQQMPTGVGPESVL